MVTTEMSEPTESNPVRTLIDAISKDIRLLSVAEHHKQTGPVVRKFLQDCLPELKSIGFTKLMLEFYPEKQSHIREYLELRNACAGNGEHAATIASKAEELRNVLSTQEHADLTGVVELIESAHDLGYEILLVNAPWGIDDQREENISTNVLSGLQNSARAILLIGMAHTVLRRTIPTDQRPSAMEVLVPQIGNESHFGIASGEARELLANPTAENRSRLEFIKSQVPVFLLRDEIVSLTFKLGIPSVSEQIRFPRTEHYRLFEHTPMADDYDGIYWF